MKIKRVLKWTGIGLGALFFLFIIIGITASPSKKGQPVKQPQVTEQPQAEEQQKEQPIQEVKEEPEEKVVMTDELAVDMIKIVLMGYGVIDVDTLIADGRDKGGTKVLILTYKSTALNQDDLASEMGHILGAYMGAVKKGWDIDELSVVVGDIRGTAIGMWYCSKEWTNDFISGEITMAELSLKVLGSMESL